MIVPPRQIPMMVYGGGRVTREFVSGIDAVPDWDAIPDFDSAGASSGPARLFRVPVPPAV